MTSIDYYALSPLLILWGGGLLVLLLECFDRAGTFLVSVFTFLFAFGATWFAPVSTNPLLTTWIRFDTLGISFSQLFILIGLASTLLAESFFKYQPASRGEYYFLLLSAVMGLVIIGISADFLTLFLGLETLSIATYVLCAYIKQWDISKEAAMKYFLMGALAAAILLYGIGLIYGALGTTQFTELAKGDGVLFYSGMALVIIGLAFKAALVPFHIWAPDVYEGAPTPVTAFMSVGTKAGAFAAFALIFLYFLPTLNERIQYIFYALSLASLIYANFLALRQNELKRFFAYSGISHAGFLLIPFVSHVESSLSSLLFYLSVYAFATLGCFAVMILLKANRMQDLRGLAQRSPVLAFTLAFCLLTLAGVPPTAGFFAKFFVFKTAFEAGHYPLVVVALLTSILSAYYYLKILSWIFLQDKEATQPRPLAGALAVGVFCTLALIILTIYPQAIILKIA